MSSKFLELNVVEAEKLIQDFLHDRIDEQSTTLLYHHLSKKLVNSLIKPDEKRIKLRPQEQFILAGIALFPFNKQMCHQYITRLQDIRRLQFEKKIKKE